MQAALAHHGSRSAEVTKHVRFITKRVTELRKLSTTRRSTRWKTVRAAVIVEPTELKPGRFPYPELEDGSMLIKMEMSGICDPTNTATKAKITFYVGTNREA